MDTTKILADGRFQVNLPLVAPNEHRKLGNSYYYARKRFFSLENMLLKMTIFMLIEEYIQHVKYVLLNFFNENSENKYYLPLHCVIREDSLTTKLRVVFDDFMKSSTGVLLNDIM